MCGYIRSLGCGQLPVGLEPWEVHIKGISLPNIILIWQGLPQVFAKSFQEMGTGFDALLGLSVYFQYAKYSANLL